jgi:hypothetical protein
MAVQWRSVREKRVFFFLSLFLFAHCAGHPLGATGTKLMTTLLHELERRGGRFGMQAICEGGGTANATIIERIPSSSL